MEFGKHLGKGIWGLADKALPVFYGVAYVLLVIRVLPEEEYGNFVLVQGLFLVISTLATAFALQPLLKFASEEGVDLPHATGAAMLLNIGFVLIPIAAILPARDVIARLLNSPGISSLLLYVPALLAASYFRNFALILLQTQFRIRDIFVVDAFHFLVSPVLVWVVSRMHLFDTAADLLNINIVSLLLSSVVGVALCRGMLRMTFRPRKEEMLRMWHYGRYSLGGLTSYTLYAQADVFFLSSFSGPAQVAVYNSVKVFTRVFDMVSQVVSMFVLPAVSRLSSKGETTSLRALVEKGIAFTTVAMVPVFLFFLCLAAPVVSVVYQGRYVDGIPLMQVFALLAFLVPVSAVASNTLMGLGEAKLSFRMSLYLLAGTVVSYLVFIPFLGAFGAALGYVAISVYLAILSAHFLKPFVPITFSGLLRRKDDIRNFLLRRLGRISV